MKKIAQKIWDKWPPILKNKYALVMIGFFVYLLFFDSNDLPSQIKFNQRLAKLNKQTKYLKQQIDESRSEYEATFSTVEQMEKFAREEYLMKKADEDLFVIEVE